MEPPEPSNLGESSLLFRRRHRLRHKLEFEAVYEARVRKHRGPLTVFALPNELPNHRLGLSVPKRVGSAPRRNRVKRCVREAFRLLQDELPRHARGGYDLVVAVRPHESGTEREFREMLLALVGQLHAEWLKRERREERSS